MLDAYAEYQERQYGNRARTIENAGFAIKKIRELMEVHVPIETLSQDDFWAFRDDRAKQVNSSASVNVTLRYLKAALNLAVKEELISKPPFRVELLPEPSKKDRSLSPSQVEKILHRAQNTDQRAHMLCYLAYALGLRLSEIITGLWWRDVDLEARWLQVEAKPNWAPKTGQRRVLTLDGDTVKVLEEWKEKLRKTGPNDYVVPRDLELGTPFNRRWAGEMIAKLFRSLEIEGGIHRLRHTLVTDALEAGIPVHVVQKMAGHTAVQTTLGHYAHVRDKALREAADLLANDEERLNEEDRLLIGAGGTPSRSVRMPR